MKILAFDTCLDKMYVAIAEDENILCSKIVETTETHYHSAFLISTIKEELKRQNLAPKDIDVVATNIGPGSFTGIRACTTVARIMGQALGTKTIGVSSLEILSQINPEDSKTLVALDARKEMAYCAIYENGLEIKKPQAIKLDDLKEILENDDYFVVVDNKLEEIIEGQSYQKGEYNLGKYLTKIAYKKVNEGEDTDWNKLLPLYIQPPALHIKKEK